MSWVYTVYEGPPPETVDDALAGLARAEDAFDRRATPTTTIQQFVEAILARWPDIGDEAGMDSPWSDGPMMNNACGPALKIGVSASRVAEVEPFLIWVADRLGVVLLDADDGDHVRVLVPRIAPTTPPAGNSGEPPRRGWFRRKG